MWKPLWVLAVLASRFFVNISAGHTSASSYSSSSSHSSSSSSSSSTAYTRSHGGEAPVACSKKCPKPHEVLDPCLTPCPPRFCGVNIAAISCPAAVKCEPGCRCADGYLRNDKGICIPEDECPKCPKPNEEYDVCPVLCPPRECGVNIAAILCPVPPKPGDPECEPGCRCSDGYLRNSTGICIPEDECPKCTQPNEVYDVCPAPCPPRRCDVDERLIRCAAPPKPGDPECEPGCRCADGYVRNNDGVCVTRDQCPPTCKKDEVYSTCLRNECRPRTCSEFRNHTTGPCWISRHTPCAGGCICKKGYVMVDNDDDTCIPEEDCPPVCKDNEVYSDCINGGCRAKNCSQLGQPIPCVKIDPAYCIKGCLCQEGYLRADNGNCVPEDQCDQCNRPHEIWDSCAPNCPPQTCESIGKTYFCPMQPQYCKGACRCEKGYYRNKIGECISEKDCLQCQGPHEYFSCGGACDNVCATLHERNQTNCPIKNIVCNPMCYCEKDYARDDNKTCIPIEKCPVSCNGDPNAVPGCGNHCGHRCSDYKSTNIICPFFCLEHGCDCKPNFVYDDNIAKCVLPKDCTPICKQNEVYDACANGGCSKRNCSQIDEPEKCVHPKKCVGGCVCAEGYLRDSSGVCVPKDECPRECNGANEYYDPCPPICPPQTCESIGKSYSCPAMINGAHCNGTCRCIKGYYRNKIGECISEKDCLQCQGTHEYFSCGGACDNVCATLHERNQTNCPIVNIVCNPMCYCEKDYARDDNKTCIPIEKCPVSCNGDPNAVPGCGNHCGHRCSDYKSTNIICPFFCLEHGCDCKPNFVYDDNTAKCVLPKDCTPVCKPNEVYDSCANGGCRHRYCSEIGGPILCIDPIKCEGGCICEDGYLRAEDGTCIPKEQCPKPECRKNEVYDTCANGGWKKRKCSELGDPIICRDPLDCIGDCVCIDGYLRNEDGVCIPENECPRQCNRPHEVYNPCPSHCPPQTCESLDRAYICPIFEDCDCNCPANEEPCKCDCCKGDCVCEDGYYRNLAGECISEENCLKCIGEHEYYSCRAPCDNVCETLDLQNQTSCPLDSIECKCFCEEGYARDKHGYCIFIDDCPEPRCGPNEMYEEDPDSVCVPLYCSELGFPIDCPRNDSIKCGQFLHCICRPGYVRNIVGICIPKTDCASCGGDPNAVSGCGNKCGKSCSDYLDDVVCALMCYPNDCDCREGFIYDEASKKCVHPEECPSRTTTPPPSTVNNTEALARLNKGSIALTGEFLYQLLTSNPNSNVVASGTSLLMPLALLTYFSTGPVLEQLLRVLYLHNKDEIKSVIPGLIADYENQTQVIFEIANKYYANINYPLSKEFEKIADLFAAGGENIDFSKSTEAADKINSWVAQRTHGKIQNLVSPDMFSGDTRLVLCNAIYFLGNWLHQFNPNKTETKDFYINDNNTVQLPIMYQMGTFNYYEDNGMQAVEMPYKNSNFSFLVILPSVKGAVITLADKLRDPEAFTAILENMSSEKVEIHLPRMSISTSIDAAKILKMYNVTEMFNPGSNGFSGILQNPEPIYVSDAVQKAFMSVDETGTEAAAATAIIAVGGAMPTNPPKVYKFEANHPYIFCIINRLPLFCGAFIGVK